MVQESVQIQCAEGTQQQDPEQAERIRAGDRAAFRALFLAYYENLCRYAYRYVGSLETAEDLVQDVFFDLWKRRATWYPKHSSRAFLYGAVRYQTLNYKRRVRARHRVSGPEPESELLSLDDPEEALQYQELNRDVARAIDALSPRCRHVFMLSREHELTYAEIAAVAGISLKTVETHMGRALQHLRERLSSRRS